MQHPNPVLLIILDGYGIAPDGKGNAISQAQKPTLDMLENEYAQTTLVASGLPIGLPDGVPGNTEVGHMTIGAGRRILNDLLQINTHIENNSFFKNEAFLHAIDHVKKQNTNLHLLGLVGAGFVHSSTAHLLALIDLCKEQQVKNLYLHLITDGRDSSPTSGIETVKQIVAKLEEVQVGKIATLSGRYYAMDRDKRWERTEKELDALTRGAGEKTTNVVQMVQDNYDKGVTDEFILPTIITDTTGNPTATIRSNDAVIFFNFRRDRARQLTQKLVETVPNLYFVSMTDYESGVQVQDIAYPTRPIKDTLPEVVSNSGYKQARIAESEKRRFVTYYVNGQRNEPFPQEEDIIVPSPKVATYDLVPEMSAKEVTDEIIRCIQSNEYPFIFVNYANPDMVGHTGNLDATIKAIDYIDTCIGRVYETIKDTDWTMLITADHGNAEKKLTKDGKVSTEHTRNLVPLMLVGKDYKGKDVIVPSDYEPSLVDIAPTVLGIMGISQPEDMTGRNIVTFVS